ncbi:MAG: hypothetical protein A2W25_09250 [candidate division Zixibacteria bacterium RBG_16_53_22]|nr:MAG: hypothetical protein A2W25_09250 [candidate division Zixibacteria bacterium RBG_16_53_22]
MTRHGKFIPFLLLANFALRLIVALRPLKYIDGLTLPDDTYLCLTLARNIANGLGPLYGFDYTNGFQPLYVFLTAPLFRLFPNDLVTPVHAALVMLIIFDTATLYLIYRLVRRESLSPITPVLIAIAWIINPYSMWSSLNGMETSVAMFFVVAGFYTLRGMMLKRNYSTKPLILLGIVMGLAMLARIDNSFLAVAIAIYLAFVWARKETKASQIARRLGIMAIGALIIYLPYAVYQFHYTGDLIPVSGAAVRHMTMSWGLSISSPVMWYLRMFTQAAKVMLRYNGIHIMLAAALAFMLWRRNLTVAQIGRKLAVANPLLFFGAAIFAAYAFYIMGPWYYPRYLYPISFLFLIYLAVLFDAYIVGLRKPSTMRILATVFVVVIAVTTIARPSYRLLFFSTDTVTTGYMNLGLWARDHFPDSTVVGSSQTGALGYFAPNLKVVNLDGVVNKRGYEALMQKRAMDYIKEAGIEYFIDWSDFHYFIVKHSENYSHDDMRFMYSIKEFKTVQKEWHVSRVKDER